MGSAQSSQNHLHMSGFFLKLAYACLCEEPPESCCMNRTSNSTSSKVHHFNYCCRKRPSTRNTSGVAAARRHKEQPPTSLLADRRAAAPSGSLHRYCGLMTSLLEECYNGTRLVFWENSQKKTVVVDVERVINVPSWICVVITWKLIYHYCPNRIWAKMLSMKCEKYGAICSLLSFLHCERSLSCE